MRLLKRHYRRLHLFFGIVWREWEPGYRISISTAWYVASMIHGFRPVPRLPIIEDAWRIQGRIP